MSQAIVVVGVGGFGREVIDVIEAINVATPEIPWRLLGVVDDNPSRENLNRLARRGVPFLGASDAVLSWNDPSAFVVAIGSPRVRRAIVDRYEAAGFAPATLVHPTVTHGADVSIGAGAILCAGVRLTTNIAIGRHVHINLNCTVGHDTRVGDYVSINPLASISGDCTIKDEVLVGVAGVVLNGLTVGRGATVGGSACVVRDVPPDVIVKGIPAR